MTTPVRTIGVLGAGRIGRWLPTGEPEFLGRDDAQVKMRGIPIDLGEIENVLLEAARRGGVRGPGVPPEADPPDPAGRAVRVPELTANQLRAYAAQRPPVAEDRERQARSPQPGTVRLRPGARQRPVTRRPLR